MISLINNILLFKYKRIWFPLFVPKVSFFNFVSLRQCKKEGVETKIANLDEFLPFFNDFAPTKHLKKLTSNNLKAYSESLVITKAFLDDVVFAMHAYVMDREEGQARLLYSATVNRNTSTIDLNLVGRANRFLHWSDMLMFKD